MATVISISHATPQLRTQNSNYLERGNYIKKVKFKYNSFPITLQKIKKLSKRKAAEKANVRLQNFLYSLDNLDGLDDSKKKNIFYPYNAVKSLGKALIKKNTAAYLRIDELTKTSGLLGEQLKVNFIEKFKYPVLEYVLKVLKVVTKDQGGLFVVSYSSMIQPVPNFYPIRSSKLISKADKIIERMREHLIYSFLFKNLFDNLEKRMKLRKKLRLGHITTTDNLNNNLTQLILYINYKVLFFYSIHNLKSFIKSGFLPFFLSKNISFPDNEIFGLADYGTKLPVIKSALAKLGSKRVAEIKIKAKVMNNLTQEQRRPHLLTLCALEEAIASSNSSPASAPSTAPKERTPSNSTSLSNPHLLLIPQ